MTKRPTTPRISKRTTRPRFNLPPISEDMKQWSAMLISEVSAWPGISTRSMFGFLFFYRRRIVFAAVPKTRGFGTPSSLIVKFNPMPPNLLKRAQTDSRMGTHTRIPGKGWFSFELHSVADLNDALFWLNHSYEAARK